MRHWNGEAGVVYDAARAMTHLLDIRLLELLAGGAFPGAELDGPTLHELLRLGLLRRAA